MSEKVCFLLILLSVNLYAGNGGIRPFALSYMGDDILIGEDGPHTLMIIDTNSQTIKKVGLPRHYQIPDMVGIGQLNKDPIFAIVYMEPTIFRSFVVQFNSNGQEKKKWQIVGTNPSGIGLDYLNQTLYIATLQDTSIFKINLKGEPKKTTFFAHVRGASRLGALVVDSRRNQLFVADPASGSIYSISLLTKKIIPLSDNYGEPTALSIDQESRFLYITDCTHKCIWSLRLDQLQAQPVLFWKSQELLSPRAIAVDSEGVVWIGDDSAKAIFGVTAQGQKIATIH